MNSLQQKQYFANVFFLFLFCLCLFLFPKKTEAGSNEIKISEALSKAERFTLRVNSTVKIPYSDDKYGSSTAAAFLVDREQGIILTNAHVARRSPAKITVSFKNTRRIKAKQAYIDTRLDLAILRINPQLVPKNAIEAQLLCKGKVRIGTEVAAFGHPWKMDFTATRGIVSGKRYRSDSEVIQTDTPLNPGNSGGALITTNDGKVIGINAAGIKSGNSEGMGFAVPASHACRVVELYKKGVDPSPPDIPVEFAHDNNLGKHLVVARVLDDLWKKKLKAGDVIERVSGFPVSNLAEMETLLRGAGNTAIFSVKREMAHEQLSGPQFFVVDLPITRVPLITERRGVLISGLLIDVPVYRDSYQRNPFKLFQVHGIESGSDAEAAGFREFDMIVSVNYKQLDNLSGITDLLEFGKQNTFVVRRYSRSKSRLYEHKILRISNPKLSVLRFESNKPPLMSSIYETHPKDDKKASLIEKLSASYKAVRRIPELDEKRYPRCAERSLEGDTNISDCPLPSAIEQDDLLQVSGILGPIQ